MAVTPLAGAFQYEVLVRNNGLLDLTLVSIVNAPISDALIGPSLVAPPGFLALYDSGLGIIDFLEGANVFGAGLSVGGFRFTSAVLAGSKLTAFEALDISGNLISGSITLIGLPGGPVPDTGGTLTLAAMALTALALGRGLGRRRRSAGWQSSPTPFHPSR